MGRCGEDTSGQKETPQPLRVAGRGAVGSWATAALPHGVVQAIPLRGQRSTSSPYSLLSP